MTRKSCWWTRPSRLWIHWSVVRSAGWTVGSAGKCQQDHHLHHPWSERSFAYRGPNRAAEGRGIGPNRYAWGILTNPQHAMSKNSWGRRPFESADCRTHHEASDRHEYRKTRAALRVGIIAPEGISTILVVDNHRRLKGTSLPRTPRKRWKPMLRSGWHPQRRYPDGLQDTTRGDIFPIIHDSSSPVAVIENDRLVGVLVRGAVIAALAGKWGVRKWILGKFHSWELPVADFTLNTSRTRPLTRSASFSIRSKRLRRRWLIWWRQRYSHSGSHPDCISGAAGILCFREKIQPGHLFCRRSLVHP